jgi:hypothetical protein
MPSRPMHPGYGGRGLPPRCTCQGHGCCNSSRRTIHAGSEWHCDSELNLFSVFVFCKLLFVVVILSFIFFRAPNKCKVRHVTLAIDDRDWPLLGELLFGQHVSGISEMAKSVSAEEVVGLINNAICKAIYDMMRAVPGNVDEEGAVDEDAEVRLRRLAVAQWSGIKTFIMFLTEKIDGTAKLDHPLPVALAEDMKALKVIIGAFETMHDFEHCGVEELRGSVYHMCKKSKNFSECFDVTPAASQMLAKVQQVIFAFDSMAGWTLDLQTCIATLGKLSHLEATHLLAVEKDNEIIIPSQARWADVNSKFMGVKSTATARFMKENETQVELIEARFLSLAGAIKGALSNRLSVIWICSGMLYFYLFACCCSKEFFLL